MQGTNMAKNHLCFETKLCLIEIQHADNISSTIKKAAVSARARGYARAYDININDNSVSIVIVCQGSEKRISRFGESLLKYFKIVGSDHDHDSNIKHNYNAHEKMASLRSASTKYSAHSRFKISQIWWIQMALNCNVNVVKRSQL